MIKQSNLKIKSLPQFEQLIPGNKIFDQCLVTKNKKKKLIKQKKKRNIFGMLKKEKLYPGLYVLKKNAKSRKTVHLNLSSSSPSIWKKYKKNEIVNIVEIRYIPSTQHKIRGKIANNGGWITLKDIQKNVEFASLVTLVEKAEQNSKVVTGTINTAIPKNCSEEEKQQIQNVLGESIASSLQKDPKNVKVTIDPETGEATYEISVDDPTFAEQIQNIIDADDFNQNVNNIIDEIKKDMPQRIQEVLEITEVKPGDIANATDDTDKTKQELELNELLQLDNIPKTNGEIKCKWEEFKIYFNFTSSVK